VPNILWKVPHTAYLSYTMHDPLDPLFQFFGRMTSKERQLVEDSVQTKCVAKGTVLLELGEVSDRMYLVVAGGLRTLFHDRNGNEVTRYLALPCRVCVVLDSFITGKPSREVIEAFADSEVITWDRATHDLLMAKVPAWSRAYILLLEQAQVINAWRLTTLLGMDAAQRYVALMRDHPELVQEVPDRIVASYIGIAPEYLSRLKRRILRGGN
jgi:CRP-like cAMP-binding protein